MELTLDTHKDSALALTRCQHRTPAGRRCRFTVKDQSSSYCPSHSGHYLEDPAAADLAPALLGDCTEINTAQDMKRVLGKIFLLLAQNRISVKKAATLTYIIQQLLRTLPAIEKELYPVDHGPCRLDFTGWPSARTDSLPNETPEQPSHAS
jgi:hypothetical protein